MGDRVYYQRDGKWKGPGIVVGKENKNVMVKHGGSYFRVHPCSLQGVESNENEPGEDKDTDKKTGENRSERSDKESSEIPQQRGVKTRSAGMVPQIHQREECTAEDGQEGSSITCRRISGDALEEGNTENTSTEPEDENVNGNIDIEVPEQLVDEENQDVNGEKTLEDSYSIDGGMNQRARKTGDRTLNDTVDGWSVGSKLKPKLKTMIRCKFIDDEEEKTLRVVSRGGKATSINRQWYNVYNSEDGEGKMFSINWERIEKWKSLPEEILISTNNQDYETLEAKHRELQNWTDYQVYDEVEDSGENYITVQWVITQKYENEKRLVKARLVARGFQEDRS